MKFRFTVLFASILSSAYAQKIDLIGIYQADWSGPSFRYVQLDCDSTYHFITHWDFNAAKDVIPSMAEKRKWKLQNDREVILETPTYGIKSLIIQPNNQLSSKGKRQRNLWTKIVSYDESCSMIKYIKILSSTSYTLTNLIPGFALKSTETYENEKLIERVTYHNLSDEEIASMGLKNDARFRNPNDPIMSLTLKIFQKELLWPVEKVEIWDNELVTVTFFDKDGKSLPK